MTHQPDGTVVLVPEDYCWTNTRTLAWIFPPRHGTKAKKTAEVATKGKQSKESDHIKAKLFNSYSLDLCHDLIALLAFNMTHVKFKKWPRRNFLKCFFFVYPIHLSIIYHFYPEGGSRGGCILFQLPSGKRQGTAYKLNAGLKYKNTQSNLRFNLELPIPPKVFGLCEERGITNPCLAGPPFDHPITHQKKKRNP